MKVGVIDYGMGNIFSVTNTLNFLGVENELCSDPKKLIDFQKLILPGVGSFYDCIKKLSEKKFIEPLNYNVIEMKKPILGICLGMQVMAKKGYEGGECDGLGWFDASVKNIKIKNGKIKIPNIGWEEIKKINESIILKNIKSNLEFYFIHSYQMVCNNFNDVTSIYNIGNLSITSSVEKENIFGTQFHPEKSSDLGKEVLLNFIDY